MAKNDVHPNMDGESLNGDVVVMDKDYRKNHGKRYVPVPKKTLHHARGPGTLRVKARSRERDDEDEVSVKMRRTRPICSD